MTIQPKRSLDAADHQAYLYRLLNTRPYTEAEIVERLKQRGLERAEAEGLAAEFRELGLIDDAVYARLFADGHESWGNDRIRSELRRRGVDNPSIALALEEGNELDRARPLFERWSEQGLEWRKIAARLARRGFSGKTIGALGKGEDFCDW